MNRLAMHLAGALMLLALSAVASEQTDAGAAAAGFTQHYVMLYYKSLEAPREFYGDLLGLQPSFEDEWVSLYAVTPGSYIGVVMETDGAYHRAKPDNAVMVSLVTDDVDGWYGRLKQTGRVRFIKELADHPSAPIRAFLVEDPGGYTVEVFQWRE